MKAIKTGSTFKIYGDGLQTYDQLPAQVYSVRFDEMSGFFLEKHNDLEVKEDKIYGVHDAKVNKVLRTFEMFNRNLGIILSGDKGIGKSMFANLLAIKAIEKSVPVIIVDSFIPGIASFLESIEQEVVVLFDEFDKTFDGIKVSENSASAQASMLSLFDGMSTGKKLFVITCNSLSGMNEYLLNRPGRFHYHFRFNYPTADEIREYLQDKLDKQYWEEIDKVISFSQKVDLNYDCLRAIAFELNMGDKFENAIQDLNILNLRTPAYNITLHFEDGKEMKRRWQINLFNKNSEVEIDFGNIIIASFKVSDCEPVLEKGITIVPPDKIKITYDDEYCTEQEFEDAKKLKPTYISIEKREIEDKIHYTM